MPTTTKKTELCPFSNLLCRDSLCAIYDDHWRRCSLHRDSLSGSIRTSVADAAVEIIKAYKLAEGDDRK